ncbi:MAG TPA: hypothetical protein VIM11_27685, partial [Tepidisphaeraceae bacterium]
EYDYAANQSIAAAGLTPAGHAALWAATQIPQMLADEDKTCLHFICEHLRNLWLNLFTSATREIPGSCHPGAKRRI